MKKRTIGLGAAVVVLGAGAMVGQLAADSSPSADLQVIERLRAYAASEPGDALARLRLGLLLSDNGQQEEAERWMAEAARLDPTLTGPALAVLRGAAADEEVQTEPAPRGGFSTGADILLSNSTSVSNYGPVGGVNGYAIGSHTCNIGNANLAWASGGTPGLAMNAYRLSGGRLVQLGQSWVKTACCAFQDPACGLPCTQGSGLGPGCQDVYTSSWNGGQGALKRRSQINAFSGAYMGGTGVGGSTIAGEIQVAQTEMGAGFPGAIYFIEGVYVSTEDAIAGNTLNNASYRRVNVNASFQMSIISVGAPIAPGLPAIYAWRDHGLGVNTPDPSVVIQNVNVPSEGRFVAAYKVTSNGGSPATWTYDYAVYNLSSDRAGGSFSVPVPSGVAVSNVGFRDVNYHSGEAYANTDWTSSVSGGAVTWSSPQTFAQNANSNAIRWGTMYNFWFTADAPPTSVIGTLGLFKPHTPSSVSFTVEGPSQPPCPADLDGDGIVRLQDLALLLGAWGTGGFTDINGDGNTDAFDLSLLLGDWGPCL